MGVELFAIDNDVFGRVLAWELNFCPSIGMGIELLSGTLQTPRTKRRSGSNQRRERRRTAGPPNGDIWNTFFLPLLEPYIYRC